MSEDQPPSEQAQGNQPTAQNTQDEQDDRISILTVARTWWRWCVGLIFALTIIWTALVAWTEIASGEHATVAETIIAIVRTSASAEALIIIYSLMTVTSLDVLGGFIVVTKRYLMNKWVKPQEERLRKEGRDEERKAWVAWNRRREEALAQGLPFNDPPPSS